jgi:hypothetical protein
LTHWPVGKEAEMLFSIGDYSAGMVVGAATAFVVRMVVWPGMDMVIAMIIGMTLGMLIHIVLGLFMAPLIGHFAEPLLTPVSYPSDFWRLSIGYRDAAEMGCGEP